MPNYIKATIKYTISLALAFLLLWYLFKDKDLNQMWEEVRQANFIWLIPSFMVSIISHISRAYRWNLLMNAIGHRPKLSNSFMAVMIGYVANLVIPRMGEVSRCAILNKNEGIPLNSSFGTVVTERIFDVIVLFLLLGITLVIEFSTLSQFFVGLFADKFGSSSGNLNLLYIIGAILTGSLILLFIAFKKFQPKLKNSSLYQKISEFSRGLLEGILSIRKLENKTGFFLHTFIIWFCYFLMPYFMFFSLPSTEHLSVVAGLSVLVMGGLGMAAPVQGGIGAFHWIISHTLVFYGVAEAEGLIYATVVHTTQAIMYTSVGLVCLVISLMFVKRKTAAPKVTELA